MNTIWCCVLALISIIAFGIIVFCVMRNRPASNPKINIRQKGGAGPLDEYPLSVCSRPYSPAYVIIINTAERLKGVADVERQEDMYRFFGENFSALAAARWICILNLLESACGHSSIFNGMPYDELAALAVNAGDTPIREMMAGYQLLRSMDPGRFDMLRVLVICIAKALGSGEQYDNSLSGGGREEMKRMSVITRSRFDRAENPDFETQEEDVYEYTEIGSAALIQGVVIPFWGDDNSILNELLNNEDFIQHTKDAVESLTNDDLIAFIDDQCGFDAPETADDIRKLCEAFSCALADGDCIDGYGDHMLEDIIDLLVEIFREYLPVLFQHMMEVFTYVHDIFVNDEQRSMLFAEADVLMVDALYNDGILRSTNLPFIDTVEAYYRDTDIDRDVAISKIHLVLYNLANAMIAKYEY